MIPVSALKKTLFLAFLIAVFSVFTAGASIAATEGHGESDTTAIDHSEAAAHAEHEPHGDEHAGGFYTAQKIWDFVYRFLNFAALVAILYFVLRKPVKQFFNDRRENIAKTLEDFEEKKSEAEARFQELESKLAALSQERERIMAEYIKEGEEEKEKIIANANEMADRIQKQAEVTIEQEVKSAKTELRQEIAEMSAAMAEELIKENIDQDDQQRLVAEYLDKVVQH
jgi:F-type H+-transporting ATPase subunit b